MTLVAIQISGAVVQAAPVGTRLEPFEPWVLDYAEAQCLAYRNYGKAQDPVSLAIRPSPNGETYDLLVGRTGRGPKFAREAQGSVDFGNGPIKALLLNYGVAAKKAGQTAKLQLFRISAADMARGRVARGVTLEMDSREGTSFSLEAMPQLLDGLAKCNDDLQDYWNMGGERNGRIAVPSKGDVRSIFTSNDYPAEALNQSEQGSSQFLLLVDAHGKVAGCHVEKTSGIPIIDVMGCQVILERMKFVPALDGKGQPARSTYVTPLIRWEIPN